MTRPPIFPGNFARSSNPAIQKKKKKVKSLAITVNETKTIYLSKAVAKSIATLLNTSINGFSLTSLKTKDLRDAYNLHLQDMFEDPQE